MKCGGVRIGYWNPMNEWLVEFLYVYVYPALGVHQDHGMELVKKMPTPDLTPSLKILNLEGRALGSVFLRCFFQVILRS